MRIIEKNMVQAIASGKNWHSGNTEVRKEEDQICVYLHQHLITVVNERAVTFTDAGWQTPTTKSRLNAICNHFGLDRFYQRDYGWYYGDHKKALDAWFLLTVDTGKKRILELS